MFSTAWILTRYGLRMFFRDKAAVALTLALPILLATIFGSAMQGMMGDGGGSAVKKVKLLVEDLDGSAASANLVAALRDGGSFDTTETTDARKQVAGGDYPAAIVIPAGYGAALESGQIPRIALLRDPSQFIAMQVVSFGLLPVLAEATLEHIGADFMANVLDTLDFPESGRADAERALRGSWEEMDVVVQRLVAEGAFDDDESAAAAEVETPADETGEGSGALGLMSELPAMLGVETEDVVGSDDDGPPRSAGVSHAIASMAVMMLMFSLVAAGGTLIEERDNGTLQRLQLAPSSGNAILVGKLFSLGLIGLMQLAILYAYGMIVFDVPILEHPFALGITSLALVFSVTGLGLFFAVICRTQKQLEGMSTLVILVMSAVGGAWFPREVTPDWFQTVGTFTLTAHAMDAFHGILWYGKGLLPTEELDGVLAQIAILLATGAVLLALSFRLFRRRFVELA